MLSIPEVKDFKCLLMPILMLTGQDVRNRDAPPAVVLFDSTVIFYAGYQRNRKRLPCPLRNPNILLSPKLRRRFVGFNNGLEKYRTLQLPGRSNVTIELLSYYLCSRGSEERTGRK